MPNPHEFIHVECPTKRDTGCVWNAHVQEGHKSRLVTKHLNAKHPRQPEVPSGLPTPAPRQPERQPEPDRPRVPIAGPRRTTTGDGNT